jgi:preprotein translocase subunit SecD
MLLKVTNNIVCLGLGLILVICLTGCSAQSFKTGTAFEINENDSSQTNTAIENSLRASGVSNPIVQTLGGNNFLVEIPSSNDASKIMTILEQHAIISSQASISASIGNPMTMKNATALIYEADLSLKDPSETDAQVMAAVQSKLLRRLSASGISGPVIQIWGNNKILVEIPNTNVSSQTIQAIGVTGLLEFKVEELDSNGNAVDDSSGNPVWIPSMATESDGTQEELTGKYLLPDSYVETDSMGKPEVAFEFNIEGAKLMGEITTVLYNGGINSRPLGIFLDGYLVSYPTVDAVITNKGVINNIDLASAKLMVNVLNSGSLDVPLAIVQQASITP